MSPRFVERDAPSVEGARGTTVMPARSERAGRSGCGRRTMKSARTRPEDDLQRSEATWHGSFIHSRTEHQRLGSPEAEWDRRLIGLWARTAPRSEKRGCSEASRHSNGCESHRWRLPSWTPSHIGAGRVTDPSEARK